MTGCDFISQIQESIEKIETGKEDELNNERTYIKSYKGNTGYHRR